MNQDEEKLVALREAHEDHLDERDRRDREREMEAVEWAGAPPVRVYKGPSDA